MENFGKFFFSFVGSLNYVGILGGIQNQCFYFFVLYHSMLSGNFYGAEIRHRIFWGLNVGPLWPFNKFDFILL